MSWQKWSVVPVWALSLIGVIAIGVFVPSDLRITWLATTLAACVIVTFIVQLAIHRTVAFVKRVTASMVGALVIVVVATAVFALI